MLRITILFLTLSAGASVPAAAQTTFSALLSGNSAVEHRDQLMLFGQFVGDWRFDSVEYWDNGSRPTQKGEIQFRWVLQGSAVQDVWVETERSDRELKMYGTTIRFYDAKAKSWRMIWIEPVRDAVADLKAERVGDEIVILGQTADGSPMRWTYSEIKPNSFHWRGEKFVGNDWRAYEDLWARRKQ
jgi:hypothetical protein